MRQLVHILLINLAVHWKRCRSRPPRCPRRPPVHLLRSQGVCRYIPRSGRDHNEAAGTAHQSFGEWPYTPASGGDPTTRFARPASAPSGFPNPSEHLAETAFPPASPDPVKVPRPQLRKVSDGATHASAQSHDATALASPR